MIFVRRVYCTEAMPALPELRARPVLQGNREQQMSLPRRLDVSTAAVLGAQGAPAAAGRMFPGNNIKKGPNSNT